MFRIGFAIALLAILAVPVLADTEATTPLTATPDLLGPTGCIITPTTEIGARTYGIGYHWVQDTFDAVAKANFAPINQLEFGVAWIKYHDPAAKSRTVFHAKYQICTESKWTPAVAVGCWDVTDQVDTNPYGVISKTFGSDVPFILNVGGAIGDDDAIMRGFFGNLTIRLRPQVDALLEWDSEAWNFGVRVRPYKSFTIDLLSVDNEGTRDFGVGASYLASF
jgi:hypothetical protein